MANITDHEAAQIDQANASGRTPVVFVHGLWLLPGSWDRWRTVFGEAGYVTLAPGWLGDPETVAEAREHPEVFAHKTVGEIVDHFEDVITKLTTKLAVIGHSFGGLLTQILAGRGRSAVLVALTPPRSGACSRHRSRRSGRRLLCSSTRPTGAAPLTYEQFRYAFANAVSEDEARKLHHGFAVPRSGVPIFPSRGCQPESMDRGEGEVQESRTGAVAHHLRREGPHRAVGHRQRLL